MFELNHNITLVRKFIWVSNPSTSNFFWFKFALELLENSKALHLIADFIVFITHYRTVSSFHCLITPGLNSAVLMPCASSRVKVYIAVKKTFSTAKRPHLLALNAMIAVNFCNISVEFSVEYLSEWQCYDEKFFTAPWWRWKTFFHRLSVERKFITATNRIQWTTIFQSNQQNVVKKISPLNVFFTAFTALGANLTLFNQIQRKSYIF